MHVCAPDCNMLISYQMLPTHHQKMAGVNSYLFDLSQSLSFIHTCASESLTVQLQMTCIISWYNLYIKDKSNLCGHNYNTTIFYT